MSKTQDIVKPIELNKEATMKEVLLRGKIHGGQTVDIVGYDLDLGRFDCTNGKTYLFNDFECLYMTGDNLEDIIKTVKHQTETRVKALNKSTTKKAQVTTSVDEPVSVVGTIQGTTVSPSK